MGTRSDERTEFLGDIITTAVEGGINSWAQVSQYQYVSDGAVVVYCGEQDGDGACATVNAENDDGDGYVEQGVKVTIETVASAIAQITAGEVKNVSDGMVMALKAASAENDAGEVDANDADVIFQVAVLGEVVYG